ncbi:10216_t:CDS:2, partial [Cetraspora pellucida]
LGSGELFYLRCILMHCAVRTCDKIKVFNNIAYSTYQETTCEMGLFANKNENDASTLDIWQKFNLNLSANMYSNYPNTINITLQQIASLLAEHGQFAKEFCLKMTSKQLTFHNEIIAHILWKPEEGSISISKFPKFLDRKAGQGKTFLINAICHSIRAAKKIVLPCRTTALLYEGGRTAHSLFQIPVKENNINIQSTIKYHSNCADLIRESILII